MAYPLIIFGAGASYDYSPRSKVGPLTSQLIDPQHTPDGLLKKYRGAGNIFSLLFTAVNSTQKTFEQALTDIKEKSGHDSTIKSYFCDFEFYLRELFTSISQSDNPAHHINNYRALYDELRTHSGAATIVTFNYDSLFERNTDLTLDEIGKYINGDIKIIKMHGSHNWVYADHKIYMGYGGPHKISSNIEFYRKNPDFLDDLVKKGAEPMHDNEFFRNNTNDMDWFPAIAVPLTTKPRHVCPTSHINELKKILPQVDRILIIGWSAGDSHLLELIDDHCPQTNKLRVLIVSEHVKAANNVQKKLTGSLHIANEQYKCYEMAGFSRFIGDDLLRDFLTL